MAETNETPKSGRKMSGSISMKPPRMLPGESGVRGFDVECHSRLSPEVKTLCQALLKGVHLGPLSIDFCEALQASKPEGVEVWYLPVYRRAVSDSSELRALAIVHVLRKLSLANYMGPTAIKITKALSNMGLNILRISLVFVEIPLFYLPGLMIPPGTPEVERVDMLQAVMDKCRQTLSPDIILVKAACMQPSPVQPFVPEIALAPPMRKSQKKKLAAAAALAAASQNSEIAQQNEDQEVSQLTNGHSSSSTPRPVAPSQSINSAATSSPSQVSLDNIPPSATNSHSESEDSPQKTCANPIEFPVPYDRSRAFGLTKVTVLPNTLLSIPPGIRNYEDYLVTLTKNGRSNVTRNTKAFQKAGASIEISQEIAPYADEMFALFQKTVAHHGPDHAIPVPQTAALFRALDTLPPDSKRVALVRMEGKLIAFGVLFQCEDTMFLKTVGLDYDKSNTCRAYFSIYYALLKDAIARKMRYIDLGPTTYHIKCQLGAEKMPTEYQIKFVNWLLKPLAYIITDEFAAKRLPMND